jgi:hypothetical protein
MDETKLSFRTLGSVSVMTAHSSTLASQAWTSLRIVQVDVSEKNLLCK